MSWLDLLLADADAAALEQARKEQLAAAGSDAERSGVEESAGMAIRLHAMLREHRQRVAELGALHDLTVRLSTRRDVGALLQDIVNETRRLLAVDIAYLALGEPDGSLTIRVTDGSLGPHMRGVRMPPHRGLAGRVVDTGEPVSSLDYVGDPDLPHVDQLDQIAQTEGLRAILGVPLRLGADVIGVLMVAHREVRPFTSNELSLVSSLASFAAIAIESAQQFEELRVRSEGVARAATLHERLMDVALSGGGVERVIDAVSEVVDGTIVFVDEADRIVAAAAHGKPTQDAAVEPIDGESPASLFRPLAHRHTQIGDGIATVPVASVDSYFGALQVSHGDGLDDAALRLLERSAMTIALVVASDKAVSDAERRSSAELLEQLLTRRIDDPVAFGRRARGLGVDLAAAYLVVSIDPGPTGDVVALAALEDLVRDTGGLAARLAGRVTAVVRGDDLDAIRGRLVKLLPGATVGIGGPAAGPVALALAHRDAEACVVVMHALGRAGSCAGPEDLGPYRFLLSRAGRSDVDRFVRLTIGALVEHDTQRNTDLVATADAYLAGGRQHAAAATALCIHPNTLYQRLQRIETLLGTDWREGDRALDIQLALRLHRLADAVEAPPT